MAKKVLLSLLIILIFSFNFVGQNVKSSLVKLDTKEMGINKDEFDAEVIEIEGDENIPKLKAITSACSVITFQKMAIYKMAKLTGYKYFLSVFK